MQTKVKAVNAILVYPLQLLWPLYSITQTVLAAPNQTAPSLSPALGVGESLLNPLVWLPFDIVLPLSYNLPTPTPQSPPPTRHLMIDPPPLLLILP